MMRDAQQATANASGSHLALDLTNEAVILNVREENGGWHAVGRADLGADNFDDQIDALRVEALVRARKGEPVLLWLPPEQIVARELVLAPGSSDAARSEALDKIATETDFSPSELTVALAPSSGAETTTVVAALTQTVKEAATYAERWGFPTAVVSTRDPAGRFGPNGPLFTEPPTVARQAGQALRRLAIAACVLLAAGGAIYGSYYALSPLLQEPTDIRSAGPGVPIVSFVLDPVYSLNTPISSVQAGAVGGLAIPRAYLNDRAALSQMGAPHDAAVQRVQRPPILAEPSGSTPMRVGGAPDLPDWGRPDPVSSAIVIQPTPDTEKVQRALARIHEEGLNAPAGDEAETILSLAPVSPARAATPAADALSTERSEPSLEFPAPDAATAPQPDTGDTGTPADAQDGADEDLTPTDLAPEEMVDMPSPRPVVDGGENSSGTTTASTEEAPAAEPADASTADKGITAAGSAPPAERPTAGAIAVLPSSTASQATDGETAALGGPVPEARPTKETSDASGEGTATTEDAQDPPTEFAALAAPQPSRRPAALERKPANTKRQTSTIAAVSIPSTVRSAAGQVGLELDETSLIGVIDARGGRQALLRMPTGDYRKVARGDDLDGWRVRSIGRETIKLTRRGQNRTLLLVTR